MKKKSGDVIDVVLAIIHSFGSGTRSMSDRWKHSPVGQAIGNALLTPHILPAATARIGRSSLR